MLTLREAVEYLGAVLCAECEVLAIAIVLEGHYIAGQPASLELLQREMVALLDTE